MLGGGRLVVIPCTDKERASVRGNSLSVCLAAMMSITSASNVCGHVKLLLLLLETDTALQQQQQQLQ